MVRFGFSGCGGFIERAVLPMMSKVQNAKALAAFDMNEERLGIVCNNFGINKKYKSFEELIQDKDVDVVYIASPNYLHKEQTIKAAYAAKHVFCQKPMGMNTAECIEMIKACRKNNVRLSIGFCYRFQGAQQKVKELIKGKAIGDVSYLHFSFNLGGYNHDSVGWRCDPKLSGGGPLMDVAPHLVDLSSYLLDDTVDSVMAYTKPVRTENTIDIDVVAVLEFKGGVRTVLDVSFLRSTIHNYLVEGTQGEIRAVYTMPWTTAGKLIMKKGQQEEEIPFPMVEHIEEEIRFFCNAIEDNTDLPIPGEAGLMAQAVIDAIYRSGETGRRVYIREILESF